MTREQIEIALAAKQELQKHLDERFKIIANIAKEYKAAGRTTEALIVDNRAEVYHALSLVCITEIGTYQGMLMTMDIQEKNNAG
jgi:hypothetical protein